MEGESPGEQTPKLGEGFVPPIEIIRQDKKLTFDEASKCLNTLGKDESCMRYAYLKISATDRKLTNIRIILNFRHLLFVDISGNYLNLQALQILSEMPFVVQIQAQRNFIEGVGLNLMHYLQDLSLARNQIKETIGISQPDLVYLDLNYNQIYQAVFESELLPELKELELRGNFLYEIAGSFPASVERLYLAENRISKIVADDISSLRHLQVLHLRNNQLRKLGGFTDQLHRLAYLNLRQNRINKMRQFFKLRCLPALTTLIILQNPVSGDVEDQESNKDESPDDEELEGEDRERVDPNRVALLVLLPNLKRINKIPVTYDERQEAKMKGDAIMEKIMYEDSSDEEGDGVTSTTDYITDLDEDLSEFVND